MSQTVVSRILRSLAALGCAAVAGTALAQAYPDRTVNIVVPFPPAGATDILARLVAQHMNETTKQPFVVTNVAGASGSIAHEQVARAAPDGYTLILGTASTIAGNPAYNAVRFDPIRDFTPVSLLTTEAMALLVHPSVPAKSVAELIALAKAKPGGLSVASFGHGSISHLAAELFKLTAGVDLLHVPFQGSAPAMTALTGGQVQVMFNTFSLTVPPVKAGKLRMLAVTDATRKAAVPDVSTVAESGYPGFHAITWLGLFGPAKLPPEVVNFLQSESVKMLARPDMRDRLEKMGAEIASGRAADLASNLQRDFEKWKKTIRDGNVKRE